MGQKTKTAGETALLARRSAAKLARAEQIELDELDELAREIDALDYDEDTRSLEGEPTDTVQARVVDPGSGNGARRFPAWCRRYVGLLIGADVAVGAVGLLIANAVPSMFGAFGDLPMVALVLAPVWALAIGMLHGYDHSRIGVGSDELRSVFKALVACVAVGGFAAALFPETWVRTVLVTVPAMAALSLLVRLVSRRSLHRRQSKGQDVRSVLLVGSSRAVTTLADTFAREAHSGMRVAAVCVPAGDDITAVQEAKLPLAGDLEDVAAVISEFGVDAVAVTAGTDQGFLRTLAWSLEGTEVELLVDPGLVEVAGPRLHIRPFVGMPLLHVEQPTFTGWKRVFKTATDLLTAGLAMIVLSPLFLIVAIAIKREDRGPVFYKQARVGRGGTHFTMWKFRSMSVGADKRDDVLTADNDGNGVLYKSKNDPRVTKVGAFIRKYSIDELPQLINVLNRTMSLVGPRPCLEKELEGFKLAGQRRLLVTPGLTGLWQINGRSDLSLEQSIRLDLRYVENWTFTGDLLIIWKTFFAVLGRRGAY
ncbi:sugar transferase [Nakamurella lactea]|uniref:sugar transferase n=1 Tax=Nakamurella lactea TaxID=459515 RepID=UPI0003F4CDD3|nr:sugar transferase [Nakamurella lactea]